MKILLFLLLSMPLFAEPLRILVSIPPQLESVQAIAGKDAVIEAIVPAGASPETYAPSPKQMVRFSQAKLLFTIGAPMELALLPKLQKAFPQLQIVPANAGMNLQSMDEEQEEHEGHHDPHVWLSIPNMCCHADCVAAALSKLQPEAKEIYARRSQEYKTTLMSLQAELTAQLLPCKAQSVVAFHPAYGYFFSQYGITQLSVEHHGKETGPKHLAELKKQTADIPCKALLTPPQSNRKSAQAAAKILGLKLVIADPIPSKYSEGLRNLAKAIADK